MKTMKKIVAILAVAMLLCSILPLSVFAAAGDTHTVDFSTISGSVQYADETHDLGGGITLDITKCHINTQLRIYSSSTNEGIATFTSEQPIASFVMNAGYKADTLNIYTSTDGSTWTLDQGVAVATSYKDYTVTLAAPSKYIKLDVKGTQQVRISKITFTFGEEVAAGCDHAGLACGVTCSNCGEYTKEHKFSNTCVAECEHGCGTANPDYVAGHSYNGTYDTTCDICNAIREITFPADGSTLTIPEIVEICASMDSGATTSQKYYVVGEITEIYNTTYGNMYITDGENTLTIYGTYDADGTNRFDAMAEQPEVGNTVTLYGKIGPYNGTAQMQYANITEIVGGCEHTYEFDCSTNCQLCGKGVRDVVCVNENPACQEGLCIYCGNDVAAVEHDFADEWDADCNYGCGYTREVEEKPDLTEDTLDFSTLDQRTECDTTKQVWESNGLVLTNNKGGSTSNVNEKYYNPARFYKGSEVIIAYPGMTKLVIVADDSDDGKYSTPWAATLDAAGLSYSVDGAVYTITFAVPTDSITLTTTAQVRAYSMTATAEKKGDEDCVHSWNAATCTAPATCALCGVTEGNALGHSYVENIIDSTCTATGTATYECSVCFDSYDEEIPVKPHNYVDGACDACGAKQITYAPITSADQLVTGEYILVVNSGYAPTTFSDTWVLSGQPTIADGLITEGAGFLWTLTVDGNTGTVTIKDANGVYISPKGSATNGITEGEYAWTWAFADGKFTFAGDKVYLASNATAGNDNKFRAYKETTISGQPNQYLHEFVLYAAVPEEEPEIVYGDADGDGEVTALDAILLGQFVTGWDVELNEVSADADGDGEVTALDAILLGQFVTGWDVELGPADEDENKVFNDGELGEW